MVLFSIHSFVFASSERVYELIAYTHKGQQKFVFENIGFLPFIQNRPVEANFNQGDVHLRYILARHRNAETDALVNKAFEDFMPDAVIVESVEPQYRVGDYCYTEEAILAESEARKKDIPVYYPELIYEHLLRETQRTLPTLTIDKLKEALPFAPISKADGGNDLEDIASVECRIRDVCILDCLLGKKREGRKNILVVYGFSHFYNQYIELEKHFGKPTYFLLKKSLSCTVM